MRGWMHMHEGLVDEAWETYLQATGFEGCEIGFREGPGGRCIAVYSIDKCIDRLMDRDGMGFDDAAEFMDFNVLCAYVGPRTPNFVWDDGQWVITEGGMSDSDALDQLNTKNEEADAGGSASL